MPDDTSADVNRVYDGYHTVHANDISFFSRAPQQGPDAAAGSRIVLDARGSEAYDGQVLLSASGSTLMLVAGASVGIRHTGSSQEVHVESDPAGKITIHQGDLVASPTMVFDPKGITMSVGLPGLGSKIEMTQDKITFQVGPLAKMEMSAQGIKLVVAGMNSVELTPEAVEVKGMSVKVNGQLEAAIDGGAETKVSAGAMLQLQGASTMIG
jgi:hypothetical protein